MGVLQGEEVGAAAKGPHNGKNKEQQGDGEKKNAGFFGGSLSFKKTSNVSTASF